MKPTILLILFLGLISCGLNDKFEIIGSSKLDSKNVAFSKDLALKIMEGQKSGHYYILNETEAETEMVKGLTSDLQKNSYEEISKMFGAFDSIQFTEAWRQTNGDKNIIYRFKGYFNATTEHPEIRVVLSSKDKLTGFFIKPWNKTL